MTGAHWSVPRPTTEAGVVSGSSEVFTRTPVGVPATYAGQVAPSAETIAYTSLNEYPLGLIGSETCALVGPPSAQAMYTCPSLPTMPERSMAILGYSLAAIMPWSTVPSPIGVTEEIGTRLAGAKPNRFAADFSSAISRPVTATV